MKQITNTNDIEKCLKSGRQSGGKYLVLDQVGSLKMAL